MKASARTLRQVITLAEIDKTAFRQLEAFDNMIKEQYGDMYTAWVKKIEPECSGQVEIPVFEKRITEMGSARDTQKQMAMAWDSDKEV